MYWAKETLEASLGHGSAEAVAPLVVGVPSESNLETPASMQNRRLALMAALAEGLPTLPAYIFQLNSLLASSPVDLKRVAEVILTDPSLTAQVLRLCNSAFVGCRQRVTRVEHALILLGTERLRTMVLTCSLVEYAGLRLTSEDFQSFWQHCFLTAALSERLARGAGYPHPEQAYLGGLLHDVGVLPLLIFVAQEANKPELGSGCICGESLERERECFGTDHCEVGRWIGTSWNFPPSLVEAMVNHHHPEEAESDPFLLGVIAAADRFCVSRGIVLGGGPPEPSAPGDSVDEPILQACLPQLAKEQIAKLAEMLETDFLHLIQLMEYGASGLFGGGIPTNPFRDAQR